MMIMDFAAKVAFELGIRVPSIEIVDRLSTPTQIAAIDPDTMVLTLRRSASDPDKAFAVSHELRHVWQKEAGANFFDHMSPDSVDAVEYNMQPEEIDANAYAVFMMITEFGLEPQFNGLQRASKR